MRSLCLGSCWGFFLLSFFKKYTLYLIFMFTVVSVKLCLRFATVLYPAPYVLVRIPAGSESCVLEGQLKRTGGRD